jgi:hypothetical protein
LSKFTQGLRSLFSGLSPTLLFSYFAEFKRQFWEIFWGATVIGVIFGIYTLYQAPSVTLLLSYITIVVVMASYAIWKPLHARLTPKIELGETRLVKSRTNVAGGEKIYAQVLVRNVTDAVVLNCRGQLLRVLRFRGDEWTPTEADETLDLCWSSIDAPSTTLEHGADKRINVFFGANNSDWLLPSALAAPFRSHVRNGPGTTYRYDIRIAADECPPVYVSIKVVIGDSDRWDDLTISACDA